MPDEFDWRDGDICRHPTTKLSVFRGRMLARSPPSISTMSSRRVSRRHTNEVNVAPSSKLNKTADLMRAGQGQGSRAVDGPPHRPADRSSGGCHLLSGQFGLRCHSGRGREHPVASRGLRSIIDVMLSWSSLQVTATTTPMHPASWVVTHPAGGTATLGPSPCRRPQCRPVR
jgi:hypothetical protein